MITADELKDLGVKLNQEFKQFLSNRNVTQIEWVDSMASGKIAKLTEIEEDGQLDYGDMVDKLGQMYTNSGLQNKPNCKLLISDLSFTQGMMNPNDPTIVIYGIMVKYQYTYDKPALKPKRDALDRY